MCIRDRSAPWRQFMVCPDDDMSEANKVPHTLGNNQTVFGACESVGKDVLGVARQNLSSDGGADTLRGISVQEHLHGQHRKTKRVFGHRGTQRETLDLGVGGDAHSDGADRLL